MMTTIQISVKTRDRLKRLALKGQTYDEILKQLIDNAEVRMLYDRERRILESEEFTPLDEI